MLLSFTLPLASHHVQLLWFLLAECLWIFCFFLLLLPVYAHGLQQALHHGLTLEVTGRLPVIINKSGRASWNLLMSLSLILTVVAQLLVLIFSFTFDDVMLPIMSPLPVLCAAPLSSQPFSNRTFFVDAQIHCAGTANGMFEFRSVALGADGRNVSCTPTARSDGFSIAVERTQLALLKLRDCVESFHRRASMYEYTCANAEVRCRGRLGTQGNDCEGFLFEGGKTYMAVPGEIRGEGETAEVYIVEGMQKREARKALQGAREGWMTLADAVIAEKTRDVCIGSVQVGGRPGTKFGAWSAGIVGGMLGLTGAALAGFWWVRGKGKHTNTMLTRRDVVNWGVAEKWRDEMDEHEQPRRVRLYTRMANEHGEQTFEREWKEGRKVAERT